MRQRKNFERIGRQWKTSNAINHENCGYTPTTTGGERLPYVDECLKEGTINELESRCIHQDYLKPAIDYYAFNEYGITSLVSAGGGNKNERRYKCLYCNSCFFKFKRVGETDFFQLKTSVDDILTSRDKQTIGYSYKKFKPKSCNSLVTTNYIHINECQKTKNEEGSIHHPHIVLNHPTFQRLYKEKFGENPIHTIHNMTADSTDALFTHFQDVTKCRLSKKTDEGYKSFSKAALTNVVNAYTDHLHRNMIWNYLNLPGELQQLIDMNKSKGLSIVLQNDTKGRFLRPFIGLPIAAHVGDLTLPILSADGFHFRTPSFTGQLFCLCSKDGYGRAVLLSFSIIPKENVAHLGWSIECNILYGISFQVLPLFTDQGILLAAARALVSGDHDSKHAYRNQIFLNLHICVIHYIRSTYHPFSDNLKDFEKTIHANVVKMANSICIEEFFCHFYSHLKHIVIQGIPRNKAIIGVACSYGVFLLRVHPRYWTIFANCTGFDRDGDHLFSHLRSREIHFLTFVKKFNGNIDKLKETLVKDDIPIDFESINSKGGNQLLEYIEECVRDVKNCIKNKRMCEYKIIQPHSPQHERSQFFISNTNLNEGLANGGIYSGVRNDIPPKSIILMLNSNNKKMDDLIKKYHCSQNKRYPPQRLTGVAVNIVQLITKQQEGLTIETEKELSLTCGQNDIYEILYQVRSNRDTSSRKPWDVKLSFFSKRVQESELCVENTCT